MVKRKLNKKYNNILSGASYPYENLKKDALPWIYIFSAVIDVYKRFPVSNAYSCAKHNNIVPFIIPFIKYSILKLYESKSHYDSLNESCKEDLENYLVDRLVSICSPVITQICEEKYKGDMDICIGRLYKNPMPIFKEYPVLARLLTEQSDYWVISVKRIISRLLLDFSDINNLFFNDDDFYSDIKIIKSISGIKTGLSDPHERGETVAIIEFNNGKKLVYKPKSVLSEKGVSNFIEWFNKRSGDISLKSVDVIDKGGYGWENFIRHYPCESDEDVSVFYKKAGSYAALFYILRGMDYHYDNLIASGKDPVFIDHEMLFYPVFIHSENKEAVNKSLSEIQSGYYESVLNTRMFPIKERRVNGVVADVSAIGYFSEKKDNLHMPFSEGKQKIAREYMDDIFEGFSFAYKLFMKNKDELLNDSGSPLNYFKDGSFRFNIRATSSYLSINKLCLSPEAMKSGLSFCRKIHSIRKNIPSIFGNAFPVELGNEELKILTRLDVPRFLVRIDSKNLYSNQHCFRDVLRYSGKELVVQRIKDLSDSGMRRQMEYIEDSLST